MVSTLASVASKRKRPYDLPRRPRPGQIHLHPGCKNHICIDFPCLRTASPALGSTVGTHRTVVTGLRRIPVAFAPNNRVVPAKIRADLPIRLASQYTYSDIRAIQKRQRPTTHQQLLYSTNLLLREYDTACPPQVTLALLGTGRWLRLLTPTLSARKSELVFVTSLCYLIVTKSELIPIRVLRQ
ncbi:hypothetical protein ABIB48_000489 [Arthrobacter sp. UYCu511]